MDDEQVSSRQDFVRFVGALRADLLASNDAERRSPSSPWGPAAGGWENPTLERFLEALAAYTTDAVLPDAPTWRTFAQILAAAKIFE